MSTSQTSTPLIYDVTDADFEANVIDASHRVPVVVDFWAAWCGPCRTLGPLLEEAVQARAGAVVLAKLDVDANQQTAQAFRVQGIPQVYGFRDGRIVEQFTGAIPRQQIDGFLDALVPSEADRAVQRAADVGFDEAERMLRDVLDTEPGHRGAALALGRLLVRRDPAEALRLVGPHRPDDEAERITAQAELVRDGIDDPDAARTAYEGGELTAVGLARALAANERYDEAITCLLAAVEAGGDDRESAREQLVALFEILGTDDPRVAAARPRLARALF